MVEQDKETEAREKATETLKRCIADLSKAMRNPHLTNKRIGWLSRARSACIDAQTDFRVEKR